jgi:phosphatidylglycerophosphatase A
VKKLYQILASTLGIGYIGKGGGTVAALFAVLCWYLLQPAPPMQWLIVAIVMILGVWSGNVVEADWGKDNAKVVIDEVAGMCISLLLLPHTLFYAIAALVLFRFFDIAKPLGIRRMERFPGGWGVMLDDVLAGVYANVLLQVLVYFQIV